MNVHIYAFGSVCRGDLSIGSDVDLLALVSGLDARFDPDMFSIYSYKRIEELWNEGNPFAWHLTLESRLLFSNDQSDYLKHLGNPGTYRKCTEDCRKFYNLFCKSYLSLTSGDQSRIFDLSVIFLSIRNIATCYSLGVTQQPNFSRRSALNLGSSSVPVSGEAFEVLERARMLCTRGFGRGITEQEITSTVQDLQQVGGWMRNLVERAENHE